MGEKGDRGAEEDGEGAKAEGGSEARAVEEAGRDRGVVTVAGQDRVETGQNWTGVEERAMGKVTKEGTKLKGGPVEEMSEAVGTQV